jgi:hypothetical protein
MYIVPRGTHELTFLYIIKHVIFIKCSKHYFAVIIYSIYVNSNISKDVCGDECDVGGGCIDQMKSETII